MFGGDSIGSSLGAPMFYISGCTGDEACEPFGQICNTTLNLCVPEWLVGIEDMIKDGKDAVDISKQVENNLQNDTSVSGGTIFSLSSLLSALIDLRHR